MENLPVLKQKNSPQDVLDEAKEAASALMEVVNQKKKPVIINGEQYLEYEDWQLISEFDGRGYTVKTGDAVQVEINGIKGAKATAHLYDKEGRMVGGAEAYCMRDEQNWRNRPWFMLASMAQTRAGAKALRNKFAFIATLSGFKPTPAEEMEGINGEKKAEVSYEEGSEEEPRHSPPTPTQDRTIIAKVEIGKQGTNKKGQPWTLYSIFTKDGGKYGTFDKKVYEDAIQCWKFETPCIVKWEKTEKGNKNATKIVPVDRDIGEEG